MATLYKHRVRCTTDNIYEYIWLETTESPDKCPSNTSHTIDLSAGAIIDTRDSNQITIRQELIPTGGNFQTRSEAIDAVENTTTTKVISYDFDISVLVVYFGTEDDQSGDVLDIYLAPDKLIGTITSDVATDDIVLTVSDTVLEYLYKGYYLKISDGLHTDDLGIVKSIDKVNKTVTIKKPAVHNFTAGAGILMTIYYFDNYELSRSQKYSIGKTIDSAFIPAETPIHIKYTRNRAGNVRHVIYLEYKY